MIPEYKKAEKFILSRLKKELSPKLTYHGVDHTYDVLDAALKIGAKEKITKEQEYLLSVACCFHDSGFIYLYKGHEERGCKIAEEFLPKYKFSKADIEIICGMIMATKIPQQPKTHLEQIIADADLDYLGRTDFYSIGKTLFEEMKAYKFLETPQQWNQVQINFFKMHHYHTQTSIKNRAPEKKKRLEEIEKIVAAYS
ncbi:MAG: HD domain-containing protein [Chitinophagales bacterium]|nr:HD domain-containing protein [Chitinophagales bacterium]